MLVVTLLLCFVVLPAFGLVFNGLADAGPRLKKYRSYDLQLRPAAPHETGRVLAETRYVDIHRHRDPATGRALIRWQRAPVDKQSQRLERLGFVPLGDLISASRFGNAPVPGAAPIAHPDAMLHPPPPLPRGTRFRGLIRVFWHPEQRYYAQLTAEPGARVALSLHSLTGLEPDAYSYTTSNGVRDTFARFTRHPRRLILHRTWNPAAVLMLWHEKRTAEVQEVTGLPWQTEGSLEAALANLERAAAHIRAASANLSPWKAAWETFLPRWSTGPEWQGELKAQLPRLRLRPRGKTAL